MALDIPGLDTIHDQLVADFRARIPTADVSRNSDNWARLRTLAKVALGLYYTQQVIYDDLFPDTAGGDALARLAEIWGLTRRAATPARKSDALRIWGTAASTITAGETLTGPNGLSYQVDENVTIPAGGYDDYDIEAVDTGEQTKLDADETLNFDSPPAGIETTAELQDDLDEDGQDEESDGELRTRLIAKIGQPGLGGAANDYKTWALEVTGVATAYVYPVRAGRGSVDLAALHTGTGDVRLLDGTERTELADYIDTVRPTAMKSLRVLEVTSDTENVDIEVEARPGSDYAFDWDDTSGWQVAAWTAGTRTMQLDSNRPSDMLEGDRIVISTAASDGTGQPYVIEALGGGADEIILEDSPSPAPVATDDVYAGGVLTARVRDAILALFNALGPAVGDYGTGEWDSDLVPEKILATALVLEGVRDATVNTPAATETADDPEFPNDDTVELLIPLQVVVREKH